MINAKVKVPSNAGKKSGGGLPLGNSQAIKVTASTPQGVSMIASGMSGGGG